MSVKVQFFISLAIGVSLLMGMALDGVNYALMVIVFACLSYCMALLCVSLEEIAGKSLPDYQAPPAPPKPIHNIPDNNNGWIRVEDKKPTDDVALLTFDSYDCGWVLAVGWWNQEKECWMTGDTGTEESYSPYSHWKIIEESEFPLECRFYLPFKYEEQQKPEAQIGDKV